MLHSSSLLVICFTYGSVYVLIPMDVLPLSLCSGLLVPPFFSFLASPPAVSCHCFLPHLSGQSIS